MPCYTYQRFDTDQPVEVFMTVAEMLRRQDRSGEIILSKADGLEKDGVRALRRIDLDIAGVGAATGWGPGGLHSDALGVHPDQAEEAMQHADSIGVPTEFDKETGCAIFRDRGHRCRYVQEMNKRHPELTPIVDRDGGYSDP